MHENVPYTFDQAYEEAERVRQLSCRQGFDYSAAEKKIEESKALARVYKALEEKFGSSYLRIGDQIGEWIDRARKAFGDLENIKGKRILDLGCGSNSSQADGETFEPWFCRALHKLGAKPVGIDIGDLNAEEFEHYQVDLSKSGVLNFLPDNSFDGVYTRLLFTSPILEQVASQTKIEEMKVEIKEQIKRLLRKDGKIIHFSEY